MTQESMSASNFVSMHPTVEFVDILDVYSFNTDVHCKFTFNDYQPQEGDRVAIFKIGWSLVKDFVVFEWAPVATKEKHCSVTFNKHILPKNCTEVYQICYISSENELHGASTPFQFHSGESRISVSDVQTFKPLSSIDAMSKSQIMLEKHKDQEIVRLREENSLLRDSLKAVISQNKGNLVKDYDQDIQELKEVTQNLHSMLMTHQKELDVLKTKITDGAEEYKKLYLEKVKVEKKYEKLRSKCNGRQSFNEELKPINDPNFDIGDLKSIPPFPSLFK